MSEAWIRIYDNRPHPVVVICSQTATSPGTSVTNGAEDIATVIWNTLNRPAAFLWIQHYAPHSQGAWFDEHCYKLILFARGDKRLDDPRWIKLTQEQVKHLVGDGYMEECDEAPPARTPGARTLGGDLNKERRLG